LKRKKKEFSSKCWLFLELASSQEKQFFPCNELAIVFSNKKPYVLNLLHNSTGDGKNAETLQI
jgi:hypothetical protein